MLKLNIYPIDDVPGTFGYSAVLDGSRIARGQVSGHAPLAAWYELLDKIAAAERAQDKGNSLSLFPPEYSAQI